MSALPVYSDTNFRSLVDLDNLSTNFELLKVEFESKVSEITNVNNNSTSDDTFNNILHAVDLIQRAELLAVLHNFHPDEKIRKLSKECETWQKTSQIKLLTHQKIYETIKDLENPIAKRLTAFARQKGAQLPDQQREELMNLYSVVISLQQEFANNCGNTICHCDISPDEFNKFLPKSLKVSCKPDAENYTYMSNIMFVIWRNSSNAEHRKFACDKWMSQCPKNKDVLQKMRETYARIASLLEMPSYTDIALMNCVLNTSEKLDSQLKSIEDQIRESALTSFADFYSPNLCDVSYNRSHLSKKYQYDADQISRYFPSNLTIAKALSWFEKYFNITFIEKACPESLAYTEALNFYEVYYNDVIIGRLLIDPLMRANKVSHAVTYNLIEGRERKIINENKQLMFTVPLYAVMLTLSANCTIDFIRYQLMHEITHAIHGFFSSYRDRGNPAQIKDYEVLFNCYCESSYMHGLSAAFQIEKDLLEIPGRLTESVIMTPETLVELSSPYTCNGKLRRLSLESAKKIVEKNNNDNAYDSYQQIEYAKMDLALFRSPTPIEDIPYTIASEMKLVWDEKSLFQTILIYYSGDYASKYYVYAFADWHGKSLVPSLLNSQNKEKYIDFLKIGARETGESLLNLISSISVNKQEQQNTDE